MKWLFIQSFQAMIENVHWNVTFRVQGIDKSVTPHCLYYVIQIMWCFLQFSDDIRRCMYTIYNSIERLNCQFRKVKKTKSNSQKSLIEVSDFSDLIQMIISHVFADVYNLRNVIQTQINQALRICTDHKFDHINYKMAYFQGAVLIFLLINLTTNPTIKNEKLLSYVEISSKISVFRVFFQ